MIGQTVYFFDINRRVYPKDGGVGRSPIWREHWRPETIVSETTRSWVTNHKSKIPKNAVAHDRFAWDQKDIDHAEFVHEHQHRIAERVGRLGDAEVLKQVAELIGYES